MKILGISDSFDAGAALIEDNKVICAVNEERLSRIKMHEGYLHGFPYRSVAWVLKHVPKNEIDAIAVPGYVDPPLPLRLITPFRQLKKRSLAKSVKVNTAAGLLRLKILGYGYDFFCTKTADSFLGKISVKIFKPVLKKVLEKKFGLKNIPIYFVDHHVSHAASAYWTQPNEEATVITLDGHGDGCCGSGRLSPNGTEFRDVVKLPSHSSVGWFYSAITNYLGFKQHRHEGKITGLAAFGNPNIAYDKMRKCFTFDEKNKMIHSKLGSKYGSFIEIKKFIKPNIAREHVAAAAQKVLEDLAVKFTKSVLKDTKVGHVVGAGGTFANVKMNQKLHEIPGVESIYVHPHMGDGGLAVGAAMFVSNLLHNQLGSELKPRRMDNVYFGPSFNDAQIEKELRKFKLKFTHFGNDSSLAKEAARLLVEEKVVAIFNGGMEYGPRALGNRTLMYHTQDGTVRDWLNQRLKRRSEFMPFAPVTIDKFANNYYKNMDGAEYTSEFMTVTFRVTDSMKKTSPGVVHIDGTARPQLTNKEINPHYFKIIDAYRKQSGIHTLINTSFNLHEEPIVCTPSDAIRSFLEGGIDWMAIGNFLVEFDPEAKFVPPNLSK